MQIYPKRRTLFFSPFLRRRGYQVFVGKLDNKKVDFIAIDGDAKFYIQVTYLLAEESTIEREFSVLESIEDNYPKLCFQWIK